VETIPIKAASAPIKSDNVSTARQVENYSVSAHNGPAFLLADSLHGLSSVQLSFLTPDPSRPLAKVFIVKNLRRDEEKEFSTVEEALWEYYLDMIGEFHGNMVNGFDFVDGPDHKSIGIPLGRGDKPLAAFHTAMMNLFAQDEEGTLMNTDLSILGQDIVS
jgi:hypothetical protein